MVILFKTWRGLLPCGIAGRDGFVCVALACMPFAQSLVAQSVAPGHSAPAITTDTGALAPGHRNFSRYSTPSLCLSAVESELATAHRSLAAQAAATALLRTPERDTLPTNVIMVARSCIAPFTVRTLPARELRSLFVLALAAGKDSLAESVLDRQVVAATTDSARVRLFAAALADYLAASPARVDAARALLVRAQRPGGVNAANIGRLWVQLHLALLDFWERTRPDAPERAQAADSILTFVREGHATSLLGKERQEAVMQCYQVLMSVAYLIHPDAPDSALLQLAQHAKDDLSWIPPDTTWYDPNWKPGSASHRASADVPAQGRSAKAMRAAGYKALVSGINWHDVPLPRIVSEFAPEGAVVLSDSARRPEPVVARVLLPADADTTLKPEMIAVRYQPIPSCLVNYDAPLYDLACTMPMTQLQRWRETYGSRLRLTVVAPSFGHAVYSGPLSPQQEAQRIAWYVRDYWHIPATVALRAPLSPEELQRGAGRASTLEITDGVGRVIYRGPLTKAGMRQVDRVPFLSALLAHANGAIPSDSSTSPRAVPVVPSSSER